MLSRKSTKKNQMKEKFLQDNDEQYDGGAHEKHEIVKTPSHIKE